MKMSDDLTDLIAKYEQAWNMIASGRYPTQGFELMAQVRQVARASWELEAAKGSPESSYAEERFATLEVLAFLPLEEISAEDFDAVIDHPRDLRRFG